MATIGSFPGMVTPQVTGSTYQNMTPEGERRMYQLQDEEKKKQEAANAQAVAQRNAQQQAAQDEREREKVRMAFNQTYGPQVQRAYQDAAVWSAPTNSPAGRARDLAIGHGFTSGGTVGQPGNMPGGTIGQPGTDITSYAAGKLPQPQMSGDQLANTLNYMWRQEADPYQRTANQMGGMMTLFHPANVAGGAAVRGGGSSGNKKQIAAKPQEVRQGPGDFDYETLYRG